MDKIVCLGKNYREHALELGDEVPDQPVIFIKPPSVLRVATPDDEAIELCIPPNCGALHYETEIVLRLDKGGYKLDLKDAERIIGAVSIGLDMTLRDKQKELKKAGHPWTTSKVFADCAVVGPWLRVSEFPDYLTEKFSLAINGQLRQEGFGSQMLFSPAACVAFASSFFPLCAGDLIYTGTPAGVGPVVSGNKGTLCFGPLRYNVVWKSSHHESATSPSAH